MTLDQLKYGERARVVEIEASPPLGDRLCQMGIHPGDELALTSCGAFRGPLLIEVHGMRVALGRGIAARIRVEPLDRRGPTMSAPAPVRQTRRRRGRRRP